jgi:hypothetical protein
MKHSSNELPSDEELAVLCAQKPACYKPHIHLANAAIANTAEWLRRYFAEQGKKALFRKEGTNDEAFTE